MLGPARIVFPNFRLLHRDKLKFLIGGLILKYLSNMGYITTKLSYEFFKTIMHTFWHLFLTINTVWHIL